MNMIKSIGIPEPCSQQWQHMTSVGGGRHCDNCRKTVIDFTKMSAKEVIATLSSKGNICGRFETDQLANVSALLQQPQALKKSWKKLSIAAAFAGVLAIGEATAKIPGCLRGHASTKPNAIADTLKRGKRVNNIESKLLTAKQIKLNTNLTDRDTINNTAPQIYESLQGMVGGIVVQRGWMNSFFHRLAHSITWPVRKIFK